MKVQLYCDNTLISNFEGSREEVGAMLKQTGRTMGLAIDDEFELQNRLTVLFMKQGPKELIYQTGKFRFMLRSPEKAMENVA